MINSGPVCRTAAFWRVTAKAKNGAVQLKTAQTNTEQIEVEIGNKLALY
ncbi:MAG: hypothetical protein WC364_10360 [Eubacteriales bacterium]|jgi:hypothetical protein